MIKKIEIQNFKSIQSVKIELGRVNVFIGENGCGKTNILEAFTMIAAAKSYDLSVEALSNRGIRVAKPTLTFNSFLGKKQKEEINLIFTANTKEGDTTKEVFTIYCEDKNNILTTWKERHTSKMKNEQDAYLGMDVKMNYEDKNDIVGRERLLYSMQSKARQFIIYSLSTNALRGITNLSLKQPLGINGEGLDLLLASFGETEWEKLLKYKKLIGWLEDIVLDNYDQLKLQGHKLGRSTSRLYFKDRFMQKSNNIFAAENANEGALHILFYLGLFISSKTPSFFGIDNIETALNPRLCSVLTKALADLAKLNDKQALITTHNPAILDGFNLNDDEQRLFVVKRSDEGFTKVERIKLKPKSNSKLKLSEMWMRGYLGGIPQFF